MVLQESLLLCLLGAGLAAVATLGLSGVEVRNVFGGDLDFKLPIGTFELAAAGGLGLVVALTSISDAQNPVAAEARRLLAAAR